MPATASTVIDRQTSRLEHFSSVSPVIFFRCKYTKKILFVTDYFAFPTYFLHIFQKANTIHYYQQNTEFRIPLNLHFPIIAL